MPHPQLTAFTLPCSECQRLVEFHSEHPRELIDTWLDSVVVVHCPDHRG